MPEHGNCYSVNDANRDDFPVAYCKYLDRLWTGTLQRMYTSRYIGSMVADFHRTLLRGGVFLYPPTTAYPQGKLRLLYEANPVAFIAEQAGGVASDGRLPVLEVEPTNIHQRTALIIGSREELDEFQHGMG